MTVPTATGTRNSDPYQARVSDSGCWQQLEMALFEFPQVFRAAWTLDKAKRAELAIIRMVRFRSSTSGRVTSAGPGLPLSVVILQPMHFAGHQRVSGSLEASRVLCPIWSPWVFSIRTL